MPPPELARQPRYTERLGDECYASPVLADGRLYYFSRTTGTYVVAAKPEFELLAHNKIEDASPAVSSRKLFLRNDKYLYCIGKM